MLNTRRKVNGFIVGLAAVVISLSCAGLLIANRQKVVDQLIVWQYHPTSEIVAFADRTGMSDNGKFYFYASQPSIDTADTFNKQCSRIEASTAILGCYSQNRIFIYDVQNKQIDGIREVTAAHEMLHAAYERLSPSDKSNVDTLLESEYQNLKTDAKFAERMQFYDRTEPGQRNNELHSIIATEVPNIAPALEKYYEKYFTNRSKVVDLYVSYASVFEKLQAHAEQLSTQMDTLAADIEAGSTAYNKSVEQLNQDINEFNAKAASGSFSSQRDFNAQRAALTARAVALDADRQAVNNNIATYSQLREELLSVSSQSEALNKSIDSSLAPAPSI